MPFYRLVTWPINHPEQYRAEDVFAVDADVMGDLATERAGYAHGFDFWEIPDPTPPDPTPKPEPAAESEPVSVPEPEPAPTKRRVKKGAATP